MSKQKYQCACGNRECERIPYPAGQRWLCGKCGAEWYSLEAAVYREQQRKRLHQLFETIEKSSIAH